MTPGLAYVIEQDDDRRSRLLELLEACGARTLGFASLSEARREARIDRPELLLAPWSDGAETAIAMRSVLGQSAEPPHLLILTDSPSAAKIALAQRAGRVELIPVDPLDEMALANRIVMTLFGAEALMRFLGSDTLPEILEEMPSLRRLFAA